MNESTLAAHGGIACEPKGLANRDPPSPGHPLVMTFEVIQT
jgi:hypothetical protein